MKERPTEEQIGLTINEIIAINPTLKEWFSNPKHKYAVLDGDKRRLPSAKEKIDLLGGNKQIEMNYNEARKSWYGNEYLILSACYRDPMTGYGIREFCLDSVSKQITFAETYGTIRRLMADELLAMKDGLIDITLDKDNRFSIKSTSGYLITDEGFRRRVKILEPKVQKSTNGRLAPQLQ